MLKFLLKLISDAFGFSKTESKGTIILLILIIISFIAPQLLTKRPSEDAAIDDKALKEWVDEVQASYILKPAKQKKTKIQPASFSWKKEKKHKDSTWVARKKEKPKPVIILDLNTASAKELQKVKGIGPSYSKRIVKYRNILGGFANISQLNEVYGFNAQLVESVQQHFDIRSGVQPLNVNSDSIKLLVKHPYISYDLARIIINYRQQHGDIEGIEDLKKIKAIDDELLNKLSPYLK